MDEETRNYIFTRALPNALDIEKAQKMILEHLYAVSQNSAGPRSSTELVRSVELQDREFTCPTSTPFGESLEKELTRVRAEIAAREALVVLQANGVLTAFGQPLALGGITRNEAEIREVKVPQNYNGVYSIGNVDRYEVPLPAISLSYRLSARFREDQAYRLASGNVYLSSLNHGKLPPRAKRCIQECIDAYRHGLYLSAIMAIGAASESLWMKLGRFLISKNPSVATKIEEQLRRPAPSIYEVIQQTWQVLKSYYGAEINVVLKSIERQPFKDRADRLCERRNYAMHSDNADTEEASFSYIETGVLLLDSINYFDQLSKLIEVFEKGMSNVEASKAE